MNLILVMHNDEKPLRLSSLTADSTAVGHTSQTGIDMPHTHTACNAPARVRLLKNGHMLHLLVNN